MIWELVGSPKRESLAHKLVGGMARVRAGGHVEVNLVGMMT